MTVTFFINYLNHHQVFVADEMYRLLGDDFRFVATYPKDSEQLKGGKDYSDRPYCILPAERDQDMTLAHELNLTSDVCIFGAGNLDWENERAATGKLSFEISERWFKRGFVNVLSPRLIKWWWLYQTKLRRRPFYKLCASAYTASDCRRLGTFKNRCYKWGYFTGNNSVNVPTAGKKEAHIMWCARFISWKHPETVVKLAWHLKKMGYSFCISMYGDGVMRPMIEHMISDYGLDGHIQLMGNIPNNRIQQAMAESDIFLFTSDRNEGWGAVLNEAMSNGCCIVANSEIGSVPYLLTNGSNGLIYKNGDIDGLVRCLRHLLDDKNFCRMMGQQARCDFEKLWTPRVAAQNLVTLISDLINGWESSVKEGPCSKV